jgi:predicted nucleotidyltransferase
MEIAVSKFRPGGNSSTRTNRSLRQVFARHPEITGVTVFGSRAKGTAVPHPYIDLAIEGIDDPLKVEAIRCELDELPLPYLFDVQALSVIVSYELREHIERAGVRNYS